MPAGNREKQQERAALKETQEVTITLRATEGMLERLAALLLFAEAPAEVRHVELGPLPWEAKGESPPQLQIDYAVVRRSIVAALSALLEAGIPKTQVQEVIRRHGAETLAKIPEDNLLPLYEDLNRMNPKATE